MAFTEIHTLTVGEESLVAVCIPLDEAKYTAESSQHAVTIDLLAASVTHVNDPHGGCQCQAHCRQRHHFTNDNDQSPDKP